MLFGSMEGRMLSLGLEDVCSSPRAPRWMVWTAPLWLGYDIDWTSPAHKEMPSLPLFHFIDPICKLTRCPLQLSIRHSKVEHT